MSLFHFAQMRLAPGSVVEPGNWGRLLKRYQHKSATGAIFGNPWILARELTLELVRLQIASTAPSRFSASFCLETEEAARRYREANDKAITQVLHRVELVDAAALVHRGSLSFVNWPSSEEFLDPMKHMAAAYWRGEGSNDFEVVSNSQLRVIDCLD